MGYMLVGMSCGVSSDTSLEVLWANAEDVMI